MGKTMYIDRFLTVRPEVTKDTSDSNSSKWTTKATRPTILQSVIW